MKNGKRSEIRPLFIKPRPNKRIESLSCVLGNSHAQFLGGEKLERAYLFDMGELLAIKN